MNYQFTTIQDRPELRPQINQLTEVIWPPFMHQDPIGNKYWPRLFDDFPQCQIVLLENDDVIGIGNTIPIYWDRPHNELPDTGWDWALETAMTQADQSVKPNALNGL
ncbi:MAG: hypothetical protein HOH77_02275, partial [Candidatus Latescibacteria bacterium]|nr:hypothetical protein [Candidatus Latescibacterota bacterium]